jgi:hypothetical protein
MQLLALSVGGIYCNYRALKGYNKDYTTTLNHLVVALNTAASCDDFVFETEAFLPTGYVRYVKLRCFQR